MDDCKEDFDGGLEGQVGYRGIYPGVTTRQEVLDILGEPDRVANDTMYYSNPEVSKAPTMNILFSGKNIQGVLVFNEPLTTLQILGRYGCPDAIFARRELVDIEPYRKDFDGVNIEYLENGLSYIYYDFPLTPETRSVMTVYEYPPLTFDALIRRNPYLAYELTSVQIRWEEAFEE